MPPDLEEVQVRPGTEADLAPLTDLYNHYVRETAVTFDTAVFTPEQRRPWLHSSSQDGPHRLLVAWTGDRMAGYATSSTFRPKPAYATSVEASVYLAPHAVGRGIGTLLFPTAQEPPSPKGRPRCSPSGRTSPGPGGRAGPASRTGGSASRGPSRSRPPGCGPRPGRIRPRRG
ncbi:GNAT family N-acetyltransferase [Streptomyces sp. NPDC090036]|uniref:GNAT family N-acetyltransferase n=1 Tax=Streptomyces sp. NPDC090036 TaxID=3365926 RepID=UPI00380F3994